MERKPIIDEWEGSAFQKWAKNFCAKNQWRVAHVFGEYEDCLAECTYMFFICKERYGATVNSEKHFMYMYKLWVTMEWNKFAVKDGNIRKLHQSIPDVEPTIESDANLAVTLSEASSELREVLKIMINAPQELMDVLRSETTSYSLKQFFNKVVEHLGISKAKSTALVKELEQLLSK